MSSNKKSKHISLKLAISATMATTVACVPIAYRPPTNTGNNQGTTLPTYPTSTTPSNTPVNTQANQEQREISAFSNSQYTYDDAKLIADFWGNKAKPWDAKLKIGAYLLRGNNIGVQNILRDARNQIQSNQKQQQSNAFFNSRYNYNDAALLAKFWGKASVGDAKLKIGNLLLNGNNVAVQQALNNARQNNKQVIEQQQIKAYANNYTYQDAELLAAFWGKATPWEAKLKMGGLVLSGNQAAVTQALNNAQQSNSQVNQNQEKQFSNAFFNSPYTYNDAVLLAKFWGKPSAWEAKLEIGSLLLSGNNAALQQALNNAR